ncbi:trefoil domain protein, partial [Ostertagia ostertagi]
MFRPWTLLLLRLELASAADVTRLVDCYPEPGATEPSCQARGCIWQQAPPDAPEGTPWCFYPTASGFLMMSKVSPTNYLLTSATSNPYGGNISPLNVSTQTNGATLFVTIGNDD